MFQIIPVVFLLTLSGLLLWVVMSLTNYMSGKKEKPTLSRGCFSFLFISMGGLMILWSLLAFFEWFFAPIKPSKNEIIGMYEIDRSFQSGDQADWQHEVYTMEILQDEVVVRDARTTTEWRYPIKWFFQPEYLWTFSDGKKKHHMVSGGPAIIRESFGYYYVFESPLYGDVVFRKKTSIFRWFWWIVLGLSGVVLFRKRLHRLITGRVGAFQRGQQRRRDPSL